MPKNPERMILFPGNTAHNDYLPLEAFKQVAASAAESGFTHVDMGSAMISRSRYQLDNNGNYCKGYDFYPEYTAAFPDLLKFCCPGKLKDFLPQDYISKNQEELHRRGEILQELGLKGSLIGASPQWLPEGVFARHPDWRGPRCDMPFRSRRPYFVPCVDNEEVLDLYREASRGVGEVAPMLDTLIYMTNDSGTSFCWGNSYPGMNGPLSCRERSMHDRVTGFMKANSSGLADGKAQVFHSFVGFWCFTGLMPAYPGIDVSNKIYFIRPTQDKPVAHENPLLMLEMLEKAAKTEPDTLVVSVEQPQITFKKGGVYQSMIKKFRKNTTSGQTSRILFLRELIDELDLEDAGRDNLLDAWQYLYRATSDTAIDRLFYYSIFLYTCMSARVLVRPLLPLPLELTEEGGEYYRKHLFSSLDSPEIMTDLLNVHGTRNAFMGRTAEEAERSVKCWDSVIFSLNNAVDAIKSGIAVADKKRLHYLQDTLRRILTLSCFAENLRNACEFQALLDRAKRGEYSDDVNSEHLERVMRRELDNTQALIKLLEEKGFEPLLPLAKKAEDENTFLFGPDLASQLKRKASLMLDHWYDSQRLFANKTLIRGY